MLSKYRPQLRRDNPFLPMSSSNSLIFKTGAQRSERPVFINKVAPCRHACPIAIDIPTAFHLASGGDIDGALRTYLKDNPLPGVCGRVCYHPCEVECNRGDFDESVNIRSLERFLSDRGQVDVRENVPIHSREQTIAVIGSGPAGLSAAYHLARSGYRVTIFEGRPELGGMLRYGIPSYRLPRAVVDREIERIVSLGIQTRPSTTVGKEVSWKDLELFDAIFLSVGLQSGKIPFEAEAPGKDILTGLDFLAHPQQWDLDDESLKTLIIGGGNVAIDVARTLVRLRRGNGTNITVVCPESRDQMSALEEEVDEAAEEGITILPGWAPHVLHRENGQPVSLDFFRAAVTIDETSGAIEIKRAGEEIRHHRADKIIIAIGQNVRSDSLPPGIEINNGRIVTDRYGSTSLPRVFAGGDATGEKAFVADAVASGKRVALAISCFLEGRDLDAVFENCRIVESQGFSFHRFMGEEDEDSVDLRSVVPFNRINTLFFLESPRNNPERLEPEARKSSFEEVTRGLEPSQMEEEIARCFRCGTCIDCGACLDFCPDLSIIKDARAGIYSFDADYCKGCGVCSVACARGVVEMVSEKP